MDYRLFEILRRLLNKEDKPVRGRGKSKMTRSYAPKEERPRKERKEKPRKPAPRFRATLVAKQKKARPGPERAEEAQ